MAAALVLILAILAQPAVAHGGEKHGAAKAPVGTEAPAASAHDGDEPASPSSETPAEPRADSEHASSSGSVLTRLHPATVHFPIALLIVAALVEMLAVARSSTALSQAAGVMTVAGAAGAVIAAPEIASFLEQWLAGMAMPVTMCGLVILVPILATSLGKLVVRLQL